jgi:hypothetical protein
MELLPGLEPPLPDFVQDELGKEIALAWFFIH